MEKSQVSAEKIQNSSDIGSQSSKQDSVPRESSNSTAQQSHRYVSKTLQGKGVENSSRNFPENYITGKPNLYLCAMNTQYFQGGHNRGRNDVVCYMHGDRWCVQLFSFQLFILRQFVSRILGFFARTLHSTES